MVRNCDEPTVSSAPSGPQQYQVSIKSSQAGQPEAKVKIRSISGKSQITNEYRNCAGKNTKHPGPKYGQTRLARGRANFSNFEKPDVRTVWVSSWPKLPQRYLWKLKKLYVDACKSKNLESMKSRDGMLMRNRDDFNHANICLILLKAIWIGPLRSPTLGREKEKHVCLF